MTPTSRMGLRMVLLITLMASGSNGAILRAQSIFAEEEVFAGGQDDINTYRIPSLICTMRGTLLAFSEGRRDNLTDGSPTDIVLKRSLGNTGKWTPEIEPGPNQGHRSRQSVMMWQPMQRLIRSTHGEAYMNPVAVIDRANGTIFLFMNYYPQPYADVPADIWMTKSADEGATWSKPVDITASTRRHELGPGVGIQLRSGRLLIPVYDGVIYSDDHGKNWKAGGVAGGKADETQVVELVDGSLMLNRRATPNRVVMTSADKGQSWGKPFADPASVGTDPDCEASLIRYTRRDEGRSKNRLLFANPADPKGRFNVTVRMSYDEGKTWPVAKTISNGPGAYSSMTVFPDGSIGILYETGDAYGGVVDHYARIVLARFTLEWLTDGHDHLD